MHPFVNAIIQASTRSELKNNLIQKSSINLESVAECINDHFLGKYATDEYKHFLFKLHYLEEQCIREMSYTTKSDKRKEYEKSSAFYKKLASLIVNMKPEWHKQLYICFRARELALENLASHLQILVIDSLETRLKNLHHKKYHERNHHEIKDITDLLGTYKGFKGVDFSSLTLQIKYDLEDFSWKTIQNLQRYATPNKAELVDVLHQEPAFILLKRIYKERVKPLTELYGTNSTFSSVRFFFLGARFTTHDSIFASKLYSKYAKKHATHVFSETMKLRA